VLIYKFIRSENIDAKCSFVESMDLLVEGQSVVGANADDAELEWKCKVGN